jgi:formylglycine-generating enzyme required for sulfatase activity
MRRIVTVAILGLALAVLGGTLTVRFVSAGQGKGGAVVKKPAPKKTPTKKSSSRDESRRESTSKPPESEAAKAAAAEANYWETIKTSTNPESFKEYLRRYPNGQFASLARDRQDALEAAAREEANRREEEEARQEAARKEEENRKKEEARKAEAKRKEIEATKRPGAVVKNGLGIELVYVPPGSFMMGSDTEESDEKPVHRVSIGNGFYMGKYEITQAEWQTVMGNNPSYFKGCDKCPVEQVSREDANAFIERLNAQNDGFTYRLPTEAEWEYACRAGTTTAFAFGDSISSDQANFDGNFPYGKAAKGIYRRKTIPVGTFQPNAFGLYDMHGNVWEWCQDEYHDNYNGAPTDGSAWVSDRTRVFWLSRGGDWYYHGRNLRSANRQFNGVEHARDYFGYSPTESIGLRIVAVR